MFGTSTPCPSSSSASGTPRPLRPSFSHGVSPGWSLKGSSSFASCLEDDSGVDLSLQEGSSSSACSLLCSGASPSHSGGGVLLSSLSSCSSGAPNASSSSSSAPWRSRVSCWLGRERMDILKRLEDMNAVHLLQLIGSYLGGKELLQMSFVSKTWNRIVKFQFSTIKAAYLRSLKLDFENSGYEEVRRTRTTPRKAMSNVSNFVVSSGSHSLSLNASSSSASNLHAATPTEPTSPSKIRHRLFTEEASKLSPGECLQSCPRCTNPSRVIPSECRATCSRISCGFEFCTKCMCSAHVGEESNSVCRTPSKSAGKMASNKSIVSMRKSRRRLKRL